MHQELCFWFLYLGQWNTIKHFRTIMDPLVWCCIPFHIILLMSFFIDMHYWFFFLCKILYTYMYTRVHFYVNMLNMHILVFNLYIYSFFIYMYYFGRSSFQQVFNILLMYDIHLLLFWSFLFPQDQLNQMNLNIN
jgi:hypothetical protein